MIWSALAVLLNIGLFLTTGISESLFDQLVGAAQKASLDERFQGPVVRSELESLSFEVWIQSGARELEVSERLLDGVIIPGLHGVEVRAGSKSAYFKPSVALTSQINDQGELLRRVCRKAGLPEDAWLSERTTVLATSWTCAALPAASNAARSIQRLRYVTLNEPLTREFVDRWARSSVLYLASHQKASGELTYLFEPIEGKPLRELTNPVRMSGCFFALSCAISGWNDDQHLDQTTRRALALTFRQISKRSRLWRDGTCQVVLDEMGQRTHAELGTTALFACGLLQQAFVSVAGPGRINF